MPVTKRNVNSLAKSGSAKLKGDVTLSEGSNVTLTQSGNDISIASTGGTGGGAPTDATYITQTANASLSAEQALGSLSTGILKNTTTTGVLSIAAAGDFPTLNQDTTGSAATLTTSRNIDGQGFDGSADITVIAPGTHAATSKTTPVDADELPLVDSAASNVLKKLTWANLKATIKSYYDSVSTTMTNKTLTSPVLNSPTINTAAYLPVDTEFFGATSGHTTVSASAAASGTLTLPAATDTLVGKATTDVLTNKDLTSGTNTFPTFNQNTTGSAATLTTARTFRTNLASTSTASFDGSANVTPGVTGTLVVGNGGTGAATLTGLVKGNGTAAMTAVTAPSGAVVGDTDTQTLTNKTISGASNTISNVPTSALVLNGAANASVTTKESTTSTSYADLTTTTDSVTVTVGASGLALVSVYASIFNNTASSQSWVSFAVSGASTQAASDALALEYVTPASTGANWNGAFGATFLLTGLSAGSTTFKMKYRVNANTGSFSNRRIAVVPL